MQVLHLKKKKIIEQSKKYQVKTIDHPSSCECEYCEMEIKIAQEITLLNMEIRYKKQNKKEKHPLLSWDN